ncbi:hypothetical protein GE09DRAFT_1056818 [Coniochaeta sp. 2T2.1]|nr:hypothetical protein GE09DRAFT_1056818 [Coniochaeta sp. 2T2.1]
MSLKRSLLLSTFAALSLFSTAALAQGNNNTPKTDSTTTDAKTTPTTSAKDAKTTTDSKSTSSQPKLPNISSSTTTTPTATGPRPKLTDLPTLSKTVDNTVPTYPPPSPPPVQNAPFMNRSTLPDGTVFIAVGAILGLFGVAILLWRGIVAYLLKRSVEKAAMAQHTTHDKAAASFPAPPDTFYKYTDDSSPSLAAAGLMGAGGRGQRRTTRGPIPSQTPSTTNLFFSPTAAGATGPGGNMNNGSRNSSFLPSGFYAATSASPAAGQGHGHSISLSNLNPATSRHSHVPLRQSPPDSPELAPRNTPPHGHPGRANNFSTSSISLNRPPSGRAPSAFLDDLLDDQPGAFPPAAPQGNGNGNGHYRGPSSGQPGRF